MTETRSVRPPESLVLREYTTYEEAQRLVDELSDAGFPVEHVRIVGHDFYSVEQVTGRLTKGRAALFGAGSGAWWGLLIGLLLTLFAAGASGVSRGGARPCDRRDLGSRFRLRGALGHRWPP